MSIGNGIIPVEELGRKSRDGSSTVEAASRRSSSFAMSPSFDESPREMEKTVKKIQAASEIQ